MSTVSDLAAELERKYPATERIVLSLGQSYIAVRSNSAKLIEELTHYFGDLVQVPGGAHQPTELVALEAPVPDFPFEFRDWPRDPGKVGKKEAYADLGDGRIVRKVRTTMHFLIGAHTLLAVGPSLANSNQIINFINSHYISRRLHGGWQLCHAAGVSHHGRGLGIAARAGGGKSTLALHLMSTGLSFVTNDRLLIRAKDGVTEMAGIPKMPRVNPGTLLNNPDLGGILPRQRERELRRMSPQELWALEEKYDVIIDSVYGPGRTVYRSPLQALLLLNWSPASDDPTRFDRLDLAQRSELLDLIVKSPGVFHRNPAGGVTPEDLLVDRNAYLTHLRTVPVYEATGHASFERGVLFCRKVLSEA